METKEDIDRDFALLASLCADSDPEDEERLARALQAAQQLPSLKVKTLLENSMVLWKKNSTTFSGRYTVKIVRPEDANTFVDFRELSDDERARILALARANFSAEDLQRYTEEGKGLPLEDLIRELEDIQMQIDKRKEP